MTKGKFGECKTSGKEQQGREFCDYLPLHTHKLWLRQINDEAESYSFSMLHIITVSERRLGEEGAAGSESRAAIQEVF